jgi:hypothetical protein
MNTEKFCYWLQGFAELNQDKPTDEQWKSIKEHLGLVFNKVTPPVTRNGKSIDQNDLDFILGLDKELDDEELTATPHTSC